MLSTHAHTTMNLKNIKHRLREVLMVEVCSPILMMIYTVTFLFIKGLFFPFYLQKESPEVVDIRANNTDTE